MTQATHTPALHAHPDAALHTPSDLGSTASRDISAALNGLLADAFALYLKTKNFHWHVSGPHFRDYHLLLDEQGADEALKLLDAKPAASYEPLFAATRGDILLVQKKPVEARAAYKLALDKADSRDATLKQSVQQRLDAIGAGS